jgi:hypothetical protein
MELKSHSAHKSFEMQDSQTLSHSGVGFETTARYKWFSNRHFN